VLASNLCIALQTKLQVNVSFVELLPLYLTINTKKELLLDTDPSRSLQQQKRIPGFISTSRDEGHRGRHRENANTNTNNNFNIGNNNNNDNNN
jgi:hypothetical protein